MQNMWHQLRSLRIIAMIVLATQYDFTVVASQVSRNNTARMPSERAFDAGLWRGEFLESESDPLMSERDSEKLANNKSVTLPDSTTTKKRPEQQVPETLGKSIAEAVIDPVELAAAHQITVDADSINPIAASDWEQALSKPSTGRKLSQQVPGPSLTTYLVACVATIVVLGAMLSPR